MGRIIVCRHGNTFDKGDGVTRVGGRTDLPLSTSGEAQAAALAEHFAGTRFAAAYCSSLQRTRATPPMTSMTPAQRLENVRGAFRVDPRYDLVGRTVVLVDDVRTTGATLEACAKALLGAGAGRVETILWARVVRARDVTR